MSKLRLRNRASRVRVPGLAVNTFEVRTMAIADLDYFVRDVPEFAQEVAASIADQGLANPVIVVRGPREDLERELVNGGSRASSLPDKPVCNVVMGGRNRVSAAELLDYTHIDCVLLPTFELALRLQDLQRESYSATRAESVGTE